MDFSRRSGMLAGVTAAGATLAINPWTAYDPINLPKMLILCTGASIMLSTLVFNIRRIALRNNLFLLATLTFAASMTISILTNDAPKAQQLFGTWGRSTGYLTYISFLCISVFLGTFATSKEISTLRKVFERLGYFVTGYTFLQWAGLDPIPWSQKTMIATLGNINFMSSFLGLVSCSYLVRVFLDRVPITTKLFFAFLTTLNQVLIFVSDSIQGFGITLTGFTFVLVILIGKKFGYVKAAFFSLFSTLFGIVALMGTAGLGPLSFLRQETVLFRLDYWKAGWNMSLNNPINGIGLDSFGDFYRQYRDTIAIERTGPQRITNTAHNIFLDVSSSSGVIAGLCFLALFLLLFIYLAKNLSLIVESNDVIAWFAILLGFGVFCLISINQIGVGVWGFVSIGLLVSYERLQKRKISGSKDSFLSSNTSAKQRKSLKSKSQDLKQNISLRFIKLLSTVMISGAVFLISLAPNIVDSKFLGLIRANELDQGIQMTNSPLAFDLHKESLILKLNQSGRSADALRVAKEAAVANPRNWPFWVEIAYNPNSSLTERRMAIQRLIELDPKNLETRSSLLNLIEDSEG